MLPTDHDAETFAPSKKQLVARQSRVLCSSEQRISLILVQCSAQGHGPTWKFGYEVAAAESFAQQRRALRGHADWCGRRRLQGHGCASLPTLGLCCTFTKHKERYW